MPNRHEKPKLSTPSETFALVTHSDEYLRTRQADRTTAFARAAMHLSEQTKGLQEKELILASQISSFVKGERLLENGVSTAAEREEILRDLIIPFNFALEDLVDHYPHLTVTEVKEFLYTHALRLGGPELRAGVQNYIGPRIVGMRSQLGGEDVAWKIPGVEDVQSGSIDQDLAGKDSFILYRGYKIPVDFKSSAESELKANIAHGSNHYLAIFSGLVDEDFGNSFRPDQERSKALAPIMQQKLDTYVDFYSGRGSIKKENVV